MSNGRPLTLPSPYGRGFPAPDRIDLSLKTIEDERHDPHRREPHRLVQ